MAHPQGIIDMQTLQAGSGMEVVLPTDKDYTETIYCKSSAGFAWMPVQLPYAARWDTLNHDGEKFVVAASGNSRLRAVSTDGKTWTDVGA